MTMQNEEQLVRKWVRQILKESGHFRLVEQSGEDLANTFIAPFTDVFKTAQVAFKDVLTSAKYTFDVLVTIDPVKLQALRNNYKERKKNIADEYTTVMAPTWEALDSDDVNLVGFMMNPIGYLGAAAIMKTAGSVPDVVDYFKEAGFGGGPSEKEKEKSGDKIKEPKGIIGHAFGALKKIFFMDAHMPIGSLMIEQEGDDKKESKTQKSADMISSALEEVGALDDIRDASKEILKTTEDSLNELVGLFKPNTQIIEKISTAANMDELLGAIKEAKAAGLELGGTNENQIKGDMEKQVKEFLNDEKSRNKFIEQLAKREGIEASEEGELPEIAPEKLLEEAQKVFFVNSTQSIRESMENSKAEIKKQIGEEISMLKEGLGIDDQSIKMIEQTAIGKQLLNLFKNAEQELNV